MYQEFKVVFDDQDDCKSELYIYTYARELFWLLLCSITEIKNRLERESLHKEERDFLEKHLKSIELPWMKDNLMKDRKFFNKKIGDFLEAINSKK